MFELVDRVERYPQVPAVVRAARTVLETHDDGKTARIDIDYHGVQARISRPTTSTAPPESIVITLKDGPFRAPARRMAVPRARARTRCKVEFELAYEFATRAARQRSSARCSAISRTRSSTRSCGAPKPSMRPADRRLHGVAVRLRSPTRRPASRTDRPVDVAGRVRRSPTPCASPASSRSLRARSGRGSASRSSAGASTADAACATATASRSRARCSPIPKARAPARARRGSASRPAHRHSGGAGRPNLAADASARRLPGIANIGDNARGARCRPTPRRRALRRAVVVGADCRAAPRRPARNARAAPRSRLRVRACDARVDAPRTGCCKDARHRPVRAAARSASTIATAAKRRNAASTAAASSATCSSRSPASRCRARRRS